MENILYFILFVAIGSMAEAIVDSARSYPNSGFWKLLPSLPLNEFGAHVFKWDWLHLAKYPMVICYVFSGYFIFENIWIVLTIPFVRIIFFDVFMTKIIKKWK